MCTAFRFVEKIQGPVGEIYLAVLSVIGTNLLGLMR